MNCPRCGLPTRDGATFCANCGASLNMVQPIAPPYQPVDMMPPMAAKKSNKLLIVAVIAVVAIVIIAAAVVMTNGNKASPNGTNGGSSNNDVNAATNTQLTLAVSSIKGYHSQTAYLQPKAGNMMVMVYANLTNNGAMSMYVSPVYMDLVCSDGITYSWSYTGDHSASDYLKHGNTMSIYCPFEIPKGVTPTTLKYDDNVDSISVTISSGIMDLTMPQYATITGVSVSDASPSSEYSTPDAGNKFVKVTLTLTNMLSSKLTLSPYYFTMETADGQTHDLSYEVDYTVPDGLQGGASSTVTIGYEISQSTTPTKLFFDDNIDNLVVTL